VHGEIGNECKILVGNLEWKMSLRRHRGRYQEIGQINLKVSVAIFNG
jgi:hypothetical protein